MQGWIKLHRKILNNPIIFKDTEYFAVWCYLLLNATHDTYDIEFKNERISLKSGQILTGRISISKQLKVSESKVQRILKKLEIEQQIEQQTSSSNRLITILNWEQYQQCEQQIEQQVNNNRTTSEQQVNTNKNVKKDNNEKNVKKKTIYCDATKKVIDYFNSKLGTNYKYSKSACENIQARIKEGYTLEECISVVDKKMLDLYFINNPQYLNPITLFRPSNFEKYLNELNAPSKKIKSADVIFMESAERLLAKGE